MNNTKLLKVYSDDKKKKIVTLMYTDEQYRVARANMKTHKVVEYFFDTEEEALKKFEQMAGENKNVEM